MTEYAENSQVTPLVRNTLPQGAQASTQPQTTGTTRNGLWFQNYKDTNQQRTGTAIQTSAINNMSPASAASITEAITQILTHVVDNKRMKPANK